jgi:hypothetical protein
VSECARVLKRAGARRVWVVTVARTLKMASKYEEQQGLDISQFQGFKEESHVSETENDVENLKA